MNKREQTKMINEAISKLNNVVASLGNHIENPTVYREYLIAKGKLEAYTACYKMLLGNCVDIKIDCN